MDYKALMRFAYSNAARRSTDRSTQNCALIINDDGMVIADDVNRFPAGVAMTDERSETRPQKYYWYEHAERNVLFKMIRQGLPTEGRTMVCPWFACADCARAIIECGIKKVVGVKVATDSVKWSESIEVGNTMLDEAGVERVYLDIPTPFYHLKLLRNGQQIEV